MLREDTKILLLLPELYGTEGGIQVIGRDTLKALAGIKGHPQPFRAVVANDGPSATTHAEPLAHAFDFKWCGGPPSALRKPRMALQSFAAAVDYQPSLIICAHVSYAPICLWLKRLFGIPYLVETYGIEVWHIQSKRQREALEQATMVVALSRFTRDRIATQIDLPPERLTIQPHAVRDIFQPGPKDEALARRLGVEGRKVLLTVSRFDQSEQYKGYDVVLSGLAAVAQNVPDVTYLLIGDGDDLSRVQRFAKEKGVADRVVFAGAIPNQELPRYYNLADLFVMPSKNEGLGIVYLEALACGKPVIASATGGARDALLDGRLGQLVDPDDIAAIAEAIVRTLNGDAPNHLTDPQTLTSLVRQHFGFERYAEALESLINRCIASGRSPATSLEATPRI